MAFQSDRISINKDFSTGYFLDVSGNINIDGSLYFNNQLFTPNSGTVTSVKASVPAGLTVSGIPITTDGSITITYESGYSISTDASKGQWQSAHAHSILTSGNPHGVTKSDVSLGNVDNVKQIPDASFGVAFGTATLDGGGKVPGTQLPYNLMEYKGTWNVITNVPSLSDSDPSSYQGNVYICSNSGSRNLGSGVIDFSTNDWVIFNGDFWEKSINSNAVVSVNSKTGIVVLTTADVSENSSNKYYTEERVSLNTDVSANTTKRHNALTLNASNGLYLTVGVGSQELNLSLASSTNTGALSSTDWNTFNNKQNNYPSAILFNSGDGKLTLQRNGLGDISTNLDGRYLQSVSDAMITFSDITTGNASTNKHGFLPKLSGQSTQYLNGLGNWQTITSGNDVSFGSAAQIPFMNNVSTNFSYSNNLTWNDSLLYIGGNTHVKSNLVVDGSLDINGTNVTIDGSAYIGSAIITNYQYMGNPTTDGSWRFFVSADASAGLVFQKRISGVWTEVVIFDF